MPAGTARRMASCRSERSSGSDADVKMVSTAIMPQPMSTPIALGMIPLDVMREISSYLPLTASGYMMTTGTVLDSGLSVAEAYLTMGLWALVCMAVGWLRMTRTD